MDAGPLFRTSPRKWRPAGCDQVALVLQGGGALGAYQGGVYQALHEAGLEPDWLDGVSIGSINAAIIAGNPRERRLERLRDFWERITARPVLPVTPRGDVARQIYNLWSSLLTTWFGVPDFFTPYVPGPWLTPAGATGATSFYDSAPLRALLDELIDFDRLNGGEVRYSAGAVQVTTGDFVYFDNAAMTIGPQHVMASGALPPALPMIKVGSGQYWDGGVVSNTPLQHLLDSASGNTLAFQIDLFSGDGPVPRDILGVYDRAKDIQYASRTRMVTEIFLRLRRQDEQMRRLLEKLPQSALDAEERALKQRLDALAKVAIVHLTYAESAYEGAAKDYDFSLSSMNEHWRAGHRDACAALEHRAWLEMPGGGEGIVVHGAPYAGAHGALAKTVRGTPGNGVRGTRNRG